MPQEVRLQACWLGGNLALIGLVERAYSQFFDATSLILQERTSVSPAAAVGTHVGVWSLLQEVDLIIAAWLCAQLRLRIIPVCELRQDRGG